MKIKDQVVILELSKQLKELGFEKKSAFYWEDDEDGRWVLCLNWDKENLEDPIVYFGRDLKDNEDGGFYPAYTVAELWQFMPYDIYTDKYQGTEKTTYRCDGNHITPFLEHNLANAMAKTLIYLKTNNLL